MHNIVGKYPCEAGARSRIIKTTLANNENHLAPSLFKTSFQVEAITDNHSAVSCSGVRNRIFARNGDCESIVNRTIESPTSSAVIEFPFVSGPFCECVYVVCILMSCVVSGTKQKKSTFSFLPWRS
jgi:hypothetical protein